MGNREDIGVRGNNHNITGITEEDSAMALSLLREEIEDLENLGIFNPIQNVQKADFQTNNSSNYNQ